MTYKSFMLTMPDDLDPSKFQSLYEEYQGQYLTDFSNAFFHISKTEEWFQERYNPVKIRDRDVSNALWAAQESELFRNQLSSNAAKTVRNLRLGPRSAKNSSENASAGENMVTESGAASAAITNGSSEAADDAVVIAEVEGGGEAEVGDGDGDGDGEGEGEGDAEGYGGC